MKFLFIVGYTSSHSKTVRWYSLVILTISFINIKVSRIEIYIIKIDKNLTSKNSNGPKLFKIKNNE